MRIASQIPFAGFSQRARLRALVVGLVLTVVVAVVVARLGAGLFVPAVPSGIVSFELAGSAVAADAMLRAWGPALGEAARLQTWVDFAYLAVYAPTLALATGLAVGPWTKRSARLGWLGVLLSWGALAAGVLDVIENAAMLRMLAAAPSDALASLARICASGKFALILMAVTYALFGAALWATDGTVAIGKRWYRSQQDNLDQT